jgi:hypothetical protein
VKSNKYRGSSKALPWLAAAGLGLSACGGQDPVVKVPEPAKVQWNTAGADGTAETESTAEAENKAEADARESDAKTNEEAAAGPAAIDLDAEPSHGALAASPVSESESLVEPTGAETEAVEQASPEASEGAPESASSDPLAVELQKRRSAVKARLAAEKKKSAAAKKPPAKKVVAAQAEKETTVAYKGPDPCQASSFSVPRVRSACASGGRSAAKRVMKDAIGKAIATGKRLACSNCHSSQSEYTLRPDAVAELKRWLDGG